MPKLTIDDIEIELSCFPEYEPIIGNAMASGDDAYDESVENAIAEDLSNGNEWAWCAVRVTCTAFDGAIKATDYLGCCSYKSRKDFIENSGYYDDMVYTCLDQLNAIADRIKKAG